MIQKKRIAAAVLAALLAAAILPGAALADEAGSCGTNLAYYFDESRSILSVHDLDMDGSYAMLNYRPSGDASASPLLPDWHTKGYAKSIKEIVIAESVKSVGANAFFGLENLERVTIPKSVEIIGANAFYGCGALKELVFLGAKPPAVESSAFVLGELPAPLTISFPERAAGDYAKSFEEGVGEWNDIKEYVPAPFGDLPTFSPEEMEEMKHDLPYVYGVEYSGGAVSYKVGVVSANSRAYSGVKVRVGYNGASEVLTLDSSGNGSGSFPAEPGQAHFSAELMSYPGTSSNKTLHILSNGKIAEKQ